MQNMERIESINNAKVKEWIKLQTKKGREKANSFLIEGEHLVEEAIQCGAEVQALLVSEAFVIPPSVQHFIQVKPSLGFIVSEAIVKKLSETEAPQGIFAVIKIQPAALNSLLVENGIILLLDAIQDPGNLGTIIRTADAAGVDGIILGKGTVDLYNAKVIRSTMGSLFHVPIIHGDLLPIIEQMQQHSYTFLAASLDGAVPYDHHVYDGPIGIVIGNEANGVSPAVLEACQTKVKIPIYGQAESLNAGIATGILIYEAVRQRKLRS